jgi:peptidyl-prolyl cis-trans isomerase C
MNRIIIFFAVLVFFLGCNKPPSPDSATTTKTPSGYAPIRGPLLARVNDWAIGLEDFRNYLNKIKPFVSKTIDVDSEKFKKDFLNDLVRTQILAQIALDRGLDKDEEVVRALRDTKNQFLASKMRTEIEKNIDISSAEVSNFYERNKQYLVKPKKVKLREIVVPTEYQAKDIYIKVLQGEDFAGLARQFSTAPSKDKGGDLGSVTPDKNSKLGEAVEPLSKDDVSRIFKGEDNNYHIVKVEQIEGGQVPPLSEIEKDLKDALKQDKIEAEVNKLIDRFKEKARIEKNEDLIK